MKKVAVRNIRLCTKDCLCLYVCPTGATDTENSIIDIDKCTGCGDCAGACPSGAISMVPTEYPPQQPKDESVVSTLNSLAKSKGKQERIASQIAGKTDNPVLRQLMEAVEKSSRLMAEDILREAGYMLPQSGNTHKLLQSLLENNTMENLPKEAIRELLDRLPNNDETIDKTDETWQCSICGHIHNGPLAEGFICPVCKQPASVFKKI